MTESLLRVYEEVGRDGYPPEWHAEIKHLIRSEAGNRCVRCGHPYEKGAGEWSPCDTRCTHAGPYRYLGRDGEWHEGAFDIEGLVAPRLHSFDTRVEARWRILTVHHLNGDKRDCRWFNLIAACQRCHLNIQRRVEMDRPWPWDHSEWFRPYVAGFYAAKLLGEELTRGETDARLDELLSLGASESAIERMRIG